MITLLDEFVDAFHRIDEDRLLHGDLASLLRLHSDVEVVALFADSDIMIEDPLKQEAIKGIQVKARTVCMVGAATLQQLLRQRARHKHIEQLQLLALVDLYNTLKATIEAACETAGPRTGMRCHAILG